MIDALFNNILTNSSENITFTAALLTIAAALAMGMLIAYTYSKTQSDETYQRSLAVTLVMLPVILSVIIIFIGSNIARAFSLAGTLSIIRFRSAPGDAKDIGFIFFDIAAGLSCGVGLFGYGAVFVVILCVILILLEKLHLFETKGIRKNLRITIPEDLNYQDAFDDILSKYTVKHSLSKIKTTDLGSLFELSYSVTMNKDVNEQKFINELRCRNGNLRIMLSLAAQ